VWMAALGEIIQPVGISAWMQLGGVVLFGLATGLVTAALSAARHGGEARPGSEDSK
jgi:hypothetical protein